MDVDRLKEQVLHNCDVTDARHAGIYSVCGLVMRLRDLYKWERRLAPWHEDEPTNVLDWIGARETLWERMGAVDYNPLSVNGKSIDAFDTISVNQYIQPHGIFYGAGYAHSLKPTFFLAKIDDRLTVKGNVIWILGQELARDLLTLPAFSQDGQIVLRTEAGRMFLWDQILYLGSSGRRALYYALKACGIPDHKHETIQQHFNKIWKIQKSIYIQHEVGELDEGVFDRQVWQQMLADYPHTAVELFIRTLKDLLADTGPKGTLTHLIESQNDAGLALYMAFGNGITRMLTKDLICAFDAFTNDGNWERLVGASMSTRQDVSSHTRKVMDIYLEARTSKDLKAGQNAIEQMMRRSGLIRK